MQSPFVEIILFLVECIEMYKFALLHKTVLFSARNYSIYAL